MEITKRTLLELGDKILEQERLAIAGIDKNSDWYKGFEKASDISSKAMEDLIWQMEDEDGWPYSLTNRDLG